MPTVVLGISASIAAYKAADLASQLVKAGIDVYPLMTRDATRFLGPATLAALTGHPCPIDVFDDPYPGEISHIHLGKIADLVAIVPASMDIMARVAHGLANDMLTATVTATAAPVLFAPGMNSLMWTNPATRANLATLESYGYFFVDPVSGRLACRTEGVGKMAEVAQIFDVIQRLLNRKKSLAGKRVIVTAGPTREPIDAVRYLSNRSSGKMGYAIAAAAVQRGADVVLVSGPVSVDPPSGSRVISVETAAQMRAAVLAEYETADIVIAAAAVSDYRAASSASQKLKKSSAGISLDMVETDDILAEMGRRKQRQLLVGFAAESENLIENASSKLSAKNLDMIVANDITAVGAGFDVDTNIVALLRPGAQPKHLPLMTKREVAEAIFDELEALAI